MNQTCPKCGAPINLTDQFCAKCGNRLINESTELKIGDYLKIYSVTVFLAPFGLYWFFKFFRSADQKKRTTAYTVLILTVLVIILSIMLTYQVMETYKTYMDSFGTTQLLQ